MVKGIFKDFLDLFQGESSESVRMRRSLRRQPEPSTSEPKPQSSEWKEDETFWSKEDEENNKVFFFNVLKKRYC